MVKQKLINQDPIIDCPDIDPFEHLVECVDIPQDNEGIDVSRRLEVDSEPES